VTTKELLTSMLRNKFSFTHRQDSQSVDYTLKTANGKESVEKLVFSGSRHTLEPVESMEVSECISEILTKLDKAKSKL